MNAISLNQIKLSRSFVIGLPIIIGLAIGSVILTGQWLFVIALSLFFPIVILFSARPYIGIMIWLFCMPLLSAFDNADLLYWIIYRILIPFTLLMTIVVRKFKTDNHKLPRLGSPELAMGVLIGYIPLMTLLFQSEIRYPLIRFGDQILIPICMYLAIRYTKFTDKEMKLLYWSAFTISISQIIFGLLSWFIPQILPMNWQLYDQMRVVGSLANPNVYATVLAFCLLILFHAALNQETGLIRTLWLSICGLGVICIFLSLERAVWLASVIVLLGLIVMYPKFFLRIMIPAAIGILFLIGGIFATQFNAAIGRLGQEQQVYDRVVVFDAMLQMVQLKPILGWGFETLNQYVQEFYRPLGYAAIGSKFVTSHNTYLTIMVENGFIGIFLYFIPVGVMFWHTIKNWSVIPKDGLWSRNLLCVFWLIIIFNFIISNLIDMRWFPICLTLWWMTLGFIANIIEIHKSGNSDLEMCG